MEKSEIITPRIAQLQEKIVESNHRQFTDGVVFWAAVGQQAINLRVLNLTKDFHGEQPMVDMGVAFLPMVLVGGSLSAYLLNVSREWWYEHQISRRRETYWKAMHPHRPILKRMIRV